LDDVVVVRVEVVEFVDVASVGKELVVVIVDVEIVGGIKIVRLTQLDKLDSPVALPASIT
jgi:hypothetical protein